MRGAQVPLRGGGGTPRNPSGVGGPCPHLTHAASLPTLALRGLGGGKKKKKTKKKNPLKTATMNTPGSAEPARWGPAEAVSRRRVAGAGDEEVGEAGDAFL